MKCPVCNSKHVRTLGDNHNSYCADCDWDDMSTIDGVDNGQVALRDRWRYKRAISWEAVIDE